MADDYDLLHQEEHPGLPAPSVRQAGGTTLIALTPAVLRNPQSFCYLTFSCDSAWRTVTVERQPGELLIILKF